MKKKRVHSRQKNMKTLVVLLLSFLLFDNILLSLANYIPERMQEYLQARTLTIDCGGGTSKKLESYFNETPGILCYTVDDTQRGGIGGGTFTSYKNDEKVQFTISACPYEALKGYLLTEECGEPEGYSVILPKYYTTTDYTVDIGSYLFSVDELDIETLDAEELVGKTVTGTFQYSFYNQDYDKVSCQSRVELTVIGIYDNYALGTDNEIYISDAALLAWYEEMEAPYHGTEDEPESAINSTVEYSVYCETRADYSALKEYIDENYGDAGYVSYLERGMLSEIQITMLRAMTTVGNVILMFFLINLIINVVYTEEREVYERRREFGLMKAIGYRNVEIALSHVKETAVNLGIVFAIVFAAGGGVLFLLNRIMTPFLNLLFRTFRLGFQMEVTVLILLAGIAAVGVGCVLGIRKIAQMQAVEALRYLE